MVVNVLTDVNLESELSREYNLVDMRAKRVDKNDLLKWEIPRVLGDGLSMYTDLLKITIKQLSEKLTEKDFYWILVLQHDAVGREKCAINKRLYKYEKYFYRIIAEKNEYNEIYMTDVETDQKEIDSLLEKLNDLTLIENVALADFVYAFWNNLRGGELSIESMSLYLKDYCKMSA